MPPEGFVVDHESIDTCRSCGGRLLEPVLDLGVTPLADRLLTLEDLQRPEPVCPLTTVVCADCGLMQIRETVAPEVLFGSDYPYYSSVSEALLAHFRGTVEAARHRRPVDQSSLVVELASNDGYLLRNYVAAGIPVLGIDPAAGPVEKARSAGIETIHDFFTRDLAMQLLGEGRTADIVHANNVLAHVADTNGFVAGIAAILKPDGLVVIECPYVRDLVESCEFDTIYHQHLCYFSATAADRLFRRHGLYLVDVERVEIHGGSLRLFFSKADEPSAAVQTLLTEERALGIDRPAYFTDFAARVVELKRKFVALLRDLKQGGSSLAAYGAAAKACTLLSYTGIGAGEIDYIVDRNPFKQGRFFPGCRLPIHGPERLLETQPDYTVILPWNFATEIVQQQTEYRRRGGRFIIPVPEPRIA